MRIKLLIAMLLSAQVVAPVTWVPAAMAQTTTSAAAADKQAAADQPTPRKPRAAPAEEMAPKGVSIAEKAQKCLLLEDNNDRATCYDAAVKPQPTRNPTIKGIRDCAHIADINDRLACFDNFANQIPKFTH